MVLVENFGVIFIHRRVEDASFDKKKKKKKEIGGLKLTQTPTHRDNELSSNKRRVVAIERVDSGVPGTC